MAESDLADRRNGGGRWSWGRPVFFAIVALALADSIARTVVDRTQLMWDAQRLAPVFAIHHGYSLYPRAAETPPVGYTYGPTSVFAYLPVTLAPDPTWALLGALALTSLYIYGPIFALLVMVARRGAGCRGAIALGMLLAAIMSQNPALAYSSMSPVHDAVALGFGLLACLPLVCREEVGWRPLLLSAALAVVAVSAKQNAVFSLVALTLYCLIAFGPRVALGYGALLAGLGSALGLALSRVYGVGPLVHYLFAVQGGFEYYMSRLGEVGRSLLAMDFLPLLLIGSVLYLRSGPREVGRPRAPVGRILARNPWVLPFLLGIGNLPISVFGTLKRGGDANSMSFTIYYLLAAASALVTEAIAQGVGPSLEFGRRAVRGLAAFACAPWVMTHVFLAVFPPVAFEWTKAVHRIRENPNQLAYEYAKKHPATVYFPWNTLAVLMAEGRLYASEDAINHIPPPGFTRPTPGVHRYSRFPRVRRLSTRGQSAAREKRCDGALLHEVSQAGLPPWAGGLQHLCPGGPVGITRVPRIAGTDRTGSRRSSVCWLSPPGRSPPFGRLEWIGSSRAEFAPL